MSWNTLLRESQHWGICQSEQGDHLYQYQASEKLSSSGCPPHLPAWLRGGWKQQPSEQTPGGKEQSGEAKGSWDLPHSPATSQVHVRAKSPQSCQTLCDPMDCSPPVSSDYGVLQATILEWVAVPSSRGSSWPRDRTQVSYVSCTGRRVLYY